MSETDLATDPATELPLAAAFAAPSREAWLKLVDKVLKGGDFEKRLVSRTADGLAIAPLATRADAGNSAAIAGNTATSRAAGTSASAMPSLIRRWPTRRSSRTCRAG